MKLDNENDVNIWKNHNEYDIIKVPPKTLSKEIRYDSKQLYHKTQKKQAPNDKRTGQPHEKIFIICAKRPIILLAIQAIISILEVACFLSA